MRPIPFLTLAVPVLNEEQSIHPLHGEIAATLSTLPQGLQEENVELLFIDDGSTDQSWRAIQDVSRANPWVKGIRFRRNCGKAAALSCAFAIARGDYVITLDGDLQDNPKEIPRIIARLDEGYDLVCGWKRQRKDPLSKVFPSLLFNYVISAASGLKLHDHNCGLKGYRKEAACGLPLYGHLHRFITLLAHSRGFRVCELDVDHRARRFGCSKYGASRLFSGLADFLKVGFLIAYERHPLRLCGGVALLLLLPGAAGLIYEAASRVLSHGPALDSPLLLSCLAAILLGGQVLGIGILGEFVAWKLHELGMGAEEIAERVGFAPAQMQAGRLK